MRTHAIEAHDGTVTRAPASRRVVWIGLLIGLLLNLTGWVGNNILLGALWAGVVPSPEATSWRTSIWSDVFSLLPDFAYGMAIVWLIVVFRQTCSSSLAASTRAGLLVAAVGGITTYFAIANAGFIPWRLALASFALVLGTKVPLALLAGRMLERSPGTR